MEVPPLRNDDICSYQEPKAVTQLPVEVLHHCLSWSTPQDLAKCAKAGSHDLAEKVGQDDLWRQLLRRDFPDKGRPPHTRNHKRKEVYEIISTGRWKERSFSDRPQWQRFLILFGCILFSIPLTLYLSPRIAAAIYESCILPALDAWDDAADAVVLKKRHKFTYGEHTWLKQRYLKRRIRFRDRPVYQQLLIVLASIPSCPVWLVKYRAAVAVALKRFCLWTGQKVAQGLRFLCKTAVDGLTFLFRKLLLEPAQWLDNKVILPCARWTHQNVVLPIVHGTRYCARQVLAAWNITCAWVRSCYVRFAAWLHKSWKGVCQWVNTNIAAPVCRTLRHCADCLKAAFHTSVSWIHAQALAAHALWIRFCHFASRQWSALCTATNKFIIVPVHNAVLYCRNQLLRGWTAMCRLARATSVAVTAQWTRFCTWIHSQWLSLCAWVARNILVPSHKVATFVAQKITQCWLAFRNAAVQRFNAVCHFIGTKWTDLVAYIQRRRAASYAWRRQKFTEFVVWWNTPGVFGLVVIPWLKVQWARVRSCCQRMRHQYDLAITWVADSIFRLLGHIATLVNDYFVQPVYRFASWLYDANCRMFKVIEVWTYNTAVKIFYRLVAVKDAFVAHLVLPVLAWCRTLFITWPVYLISLGYYTLKLRVVPAVVRFLRRYVVRPLACVASTVRKGLLWTKTTTVQAGVAVAAAVVKALMWIRRIAKLICSTFYAEILAPIGRFCFRCAHAVRSACHAVIQAARSVIATLVHGLRTAYMATVRGGRLVVVTFYDHVLSPFGRFIKRSALRVKNLGITVRNFAVSHVLAFYATLKAGVSTLVSTFRECVVLPAKKILILFFHAAKAVLVATRAGIASVAKAFANFVEATVVVPATNFVSAFVSAFITAKRHVALILAEVWRQVTTMLRSLAVALKSAVTEALAFLAGQGRQLVLVLKEGAQESVRSLQSAKHRVAEWVGTNGPEK